MAANNMKAVKLRMKSIQSTMQITKAMELVAASKLRKAKDRAEAVRPSYEVLREALMRMAAENTDFASVYTKDAGSDRYCCVVIAGDRGLAGGYNSNLFKAFEAEMKGKDCCVIPVGKKAVEYFRKRGTEILTEEYAQASDISIADVFEIAGIICRGYRKKEYGHVMLCYTFFRSMLEQSAGTMSLLPLSDFAPDKVERNEARNLILYEPDSEAVFDAVVPEYLTTLIYGALCESVASELAARRTAMDAATSNAEEMLGNLELYYNRARQAGITQEITEIVAGAEGL